MEFLTSLKRRIKPSFIAMVSLALFPCCSYASETGTNQWEVVLKSLADSMTGPVAYSVAIIAIVLSGLTMAFADLQGGAKRFVQSAVGLSVAFFAMQIVTGFLHFSGAVI